MTQSTSNHCQYCNRPFADDELLALHWGVAHSDRLDREEQEAYEVALEVEARELRRYQLKSLAGVVLLYFGLLIAYAVFG